jgi:hypothetical protein
VAIATAIPTRAGAPATIANAPITPDRAVTEPTERSIPPDTITTVMPIAIMVITAVCLATLPRFPIERNLGSSVVINVQSATRLINGRKRLIQFDIVVSLPRRLAHAGLHRFFELSILPLPRV